MIENCNFSIADSLKNVYLTSIPHIQNGKLNFQFGKAIKKLLLPKTQLNSGKRQIYQITGSIDFIKQFPKSFQGNYRLKQYPGYFRMTCICCNLGNHKTTVGTSEALLKVYHLKVLKWWMVNQLIDQMSIF